MVRMFIQTCYQVIIEIHKTQSLYEHPSKIFINIIHIFLTVIFITKKIISLKVSFVINYFYFLLGTIESIAASDHRQKK